MNYRDHNRTTWYLVSREALFSIKNAIFWHFYQLWEQMMLLTIWKQDKRLPLYGKAWAFHATSHTLRSFSPFLTQIISMPKYLSGTYLVLEHNNERQQMWEAVFFSSDNKANRSRSRVKGIRGTSSVYCLSVKKLMCGTIFYNLSFVIKCSKKRRCCCKLLWPH